MVLGNDRGGGIPHLRVNGDWKWEWGGQPGGVCQVREGGRGTRGVGRGWGGNELRPLAWRGDLVLTRGLGTKE